MRSNKTNYFAVGSFVIACVVGAVVAVAMLKGHTGATDNYYAVYKNVTGVKFGTQVLYEGYPIGQVESVTPTPQEGAMVFRVDFTVQEGWSIPLDSTAGIGASGLLSAITINISAGFSGVPLEPGTEVAGREAADIFATVSSVADQISELTEGDIKPLLDNVNRSAKALADLLANDGQSMVAEAHAVISDVKLMTDDLVKKVPGITDNMDVASVNFVKLTDDMNTTRQHVDALIASANGVIKSANGVVASTDGVIGENRDDVRAAIGDLKTVTDSLARHIDSFNQNLDGTARNFYEFSRQIRQNPGSLIGGSAPRDAE